MSTRIRYTEEFKREAVSQVVDRGHSVTSVASRLGVSTKSLYDWKKRYAGDGRKARRAKDADELKALKAELKRVTEERDILKKAAAYFAATTTFKPGPGANEQTHHAFARGNDESRSKVD